MTNENRTNMEFTENELLNILDWFNGYIVKYYELDHNGVAQGLPENHKTLAGRFLKEISDIPE